MSRFEFAAETSAPHGLKKSLVRSAFAAVMVSGLVACSAMPSSMKPDAIYGEAKPSPTPEGTKGFPDLANVPDQKPQVTSATDQKAIAESLVEDRAVAQEGDKDLRAGGVLPPPAKNAAVKAPDETMMKADATEPASPAVAAAAPATVKTPAPDVTDAPAKMVTQNTPAKQAEPAPAPAPAPESEPVPAPVATPAATPIATPATPKPATRSVDVAPPPPPPAAQEPAYKPAFVADEAETALPEVSAEPATPGIKLPPGVIGMPPRGGHKSFADILTPEQKAERKMAVEEGKKGSDTAKPADDDSESDGVIAAPTKPVEVQPVPDTQ